MAGVWGAIPLVRNLAARFEEKYPRACALAEPLVLLALLLLCTAYLVDGSFNPFLYFRF